MGEEKSKQASNLQFVQKDVGSSQVTVYVILVVLLLAAQIVSPGYLKPTHVAGTLKLASFMGIAVTGQNLTILTGGINLSIANITTFVNVIAVQIMMGRDENLAAALLVIIVIGATVGFINGVGVHWLEIPPFIMTLGMGMVTQGAFLTYIKDAPKGNTPPLLEAVCGQSFIGILPGIVAMWAVMAAVTIVLLRNTPYGRKIYSASTNEQTTRFSGVHTGRVTLSVYLISAIIATVSGFFSAGYMGTSFLDVGISYNTKTIAAAIIGGTAITSGKGRYIGTTAGAIIMTILDDFLTIANISEAGRQIMQGVIIILLMLMYNREKYRRQCSIQSETVYGTVHKTIQETGGTIHIERYN